MGGRGGGWPPFWGVFGVSQHVQACKAWAMMLRGPRTRRSGVPYEKGGCRGAAGSRRRLGKKRRGALSSALFIVMTVFANDAVL
jgi:hypothetical protein